MQERSKGWPKRLLRSRSRGRDAGAEEGRADGPPPPAQSWQVCAAILATLLLSACGELSIGGDPAYPASGRMEIWNRTEEPLVLTGSNILNSMPPDSPRLDVGPCEHVVVASFPQNTIEFRSAHGGYIATMGNAGMPGGLAPRPLYIVFTAEVGGIDTPDAPPTDLPPCEGRPQVQEGV